MRTSTAGGSSAVWSLAWYTRYRLVYLVRANVVRTGSMDTQSLLLGVGYQWDVQPWLTGTARPPVPNKVAKKNELTVFAGRTIVNSFKSEYSLASGIEYRRWLGRFFEGTIAVLDEGENERIERNGAVAQLWLASESLSVTASLSTSEAGGIMQGTVRIDRSGGEGIIPYQG